MNEEKPELRELDHQALEYIIAVWLKTGFTPSSAELAERFNIGRGGSTNKVFTALEAHGFITFYEGRNRYIPTNWRELIEGEFANSLGYEFSISVPHAADWSRARDTVPTDDFYRSKGYESLDSVPSCEEWNRARNKVSSDMEAVRAKQRARAKKYRDGRKKV